MVETEEILEKWAEQKIKDLFGNFNGVFEKNQSAPVRLRNFIDGEWRGTMEYKDIINPLNGKRFIKMPLTSEEEIQPFIESLARCPRHGLHNPIKNPERYAMYGEVVAKAARFLRTQAGRHYFAKLIQLVMPKDMTQCYGEVDVTARFLEDYSGNGVRYLGKGQTTPGDHLGQEVHDYRWPYGPVALITPFNFPLEIPVLQLMGALFMGNKPIMKAASTVSIVAEAFVRLLLDCGMPKDDMLLIHCNGKIMEKIVINPAVQLVQFTGSSDVAHHLKDVIPGEIRWEDAGFDWKILGPNPIMNMYNFVVNQCDADAYNATGQKCSAQSILFIHENWSPELLVRDMEKLAKKRNLKDLTFGPVLTWTNKQIQEHIDSLLKIENSVLLFGGKPIVGKHNIPECYGSYEPTAVFVPLNRLLDNFDLVTREVFGPFQVVTKWQSKEDLDTILEVMERMGSRLTAAVVDNEPDFQMYVLGRTTNGTTYTGIKARTTGAPEWHWFGPTGPHSAGIGTVEAILLVYSQNRTIIRDANSNKF